MTNAPERLAAAATNSDDKIRDAVKSYYSETLSHSNDLKTSACATSEAPAPALAALVARLHPETRDRYFGCGLIAPEALSGARILDLGCGAGRDVYVLSQLVGETGSVVGVDMTEEQLAVAERWRDWHRAAFGHRVSNVAFLRGYLEELDALDLEPGAIDVAVSNCVLNLATDKPAALRGVRRLLKPGGEFYFADVYADRPLPAEAASDPVLYGECLGGALVWSEFVALARATGFATPRLVAAAPIRHYSAEIERALGETRFVSATVRLFAAPETPAQGACAATYLGGAETVSNATGDVFAFDLDTRFTPGETRVIGAETAQALRASRFAPHFTFAATEADAAASPAADALDPFIRAGGGAGGCCG